ncbi:hypothetical protein CPB83DRAFT_900915 [Crepidotus variabilis]|uniref:Uncharacterized protein n=1 Tax=Crepidotus variabilis TaxID=179855 RepID=A0A9P6BC50_9AGAR|nr:hypothetical protein CPB83DRAFT_900915 [Crepidotus variabilis]
MDYDLFQDLDLSSTTLQLGDQAFELTDSDYEQWIKSLIDTNVGPFDPFAGLEDLLSTTSAPGGQTNQDVTTVEDPNDMQTPLNAEAYDTSQVYATQDEPVVPTNTHYLQAPASSPAVQSIAVVLDFFETTGKVFSTEVERQALRQLKSVLLYVSSLETVQ